ncbi:MAG: hypothetical protein HY836_13555 [Aquabacterium sp.]|uniref:hypothetical protein n=1 Tax=Aquabacterium sp. TaxID=1872578 RepID=UPI0025B7CD24|nr:hypothetical protein [Aquabacterium sp.]MBI5926612.1 hypothetical protein [Aquabacterium sp.]
MRTLTVQELNAVSGAAITLPTVGVTTGGLTFTTNGNTTTVSWKQINDLVKFISNLIGKL